MNIKEWWKKFWTKEDVFEDIELEKGIITILTSDMEYKINFTGYYICSYEKFNNNGFFA